MQSIVTQFYVSRTRAYHNACTEGLQPFEARLSMHPARFTRFKSALRPPSSLHILPIPHIPHAHARHRDRSCGGSSDLVLDRLGLGLDRGAVAAEVVVVDKAEALRELRGGVRRVLRVDQMDPPTWSAHAPKKTDWEGEA